MVCMEFETRAVRWNPLSYDDPLYKLYLNSLFNKVFKFQTNERHQLITWPEY